MIKSIEFKNFRNLDKKYNLKENLNVIIGKNNSGKTNLLDGIKLAFSVLTNEYFRVAKSDFFNSDDSKAIEISVELDNKNPIDSLIYYEETKGKRIAKYGFKLIIRKSAGNRYSKEMFLLNGSNIAMDILLEDSKIPNIITIPLIRIEELFTKGVTIGLNTFVDSDERYLEFKKSVKDNMKDDLKGKEEEFKGLCNDFGQDFWFEITDPKIGNEKIYIVDGEKEHNFMIGSGYKSIANILLNVISDEFNIILIDEIENHLHPSLIRTLIRKLETETNSQIISTTHSSVVINELFLKEIVDISGIDISFSDDDTNQKKLNTFLHPGRNELLMADHVVLVEGYTEEVLLKNYLKKNNGNWTIVNVAGVMFEPYIKLAKKLNKKTIVISDSDCSTNHDLNKDSTRFTNLSDLCEKEDIKLIKVYNTLETDLFANGFLTGIKDINKYLTKHSKHKNIMIAKPKMKMELTENIILANIDLSTWHVIKGIINEFKSN